MDDTSDCEQAGGHWGQTNLICFKGWVCYGIALLAVACSSWVHRFSLFQPSRPGLVCCPVIEFKIEMFHVTCARFFNLTDCTKLNIERTSVWRAHACPLDNPWKLLWLSGAVCSVQGGIAGEWMYYLSLPSPQPWRRGKRRGMPLSLGSPPSVPSLMAMIPSAISPSKGDPNAPGERSSPSQTSDCPVTSGELENNSVDEEILNRHWIYKCT